MVGITIWVHIWQKLYRRSLEVFQVYKEKFCFNSSKSSTQNMYKKRIVIGVYKKEK